MAKVDRGRERPSVALCAPVEASVMAIDGWDALWLALEWVPHPCDPINPTTPAAYSQRTP